MPYHRDCWEQAGADTATLVQQLRVRNDPLTRQMVICRLKKEQGSFAHPPAVMLSHVSMHYSNLSTCIAGHERVAYGPALMVTVITVDHAWRTAFRQPAQIDMRRLSASDVGLTGGISRHIPRWNRSARHGTVEDRGRPADTAPLFDGGCQRLRIRWGRQLFFWSRRSPLQLEVAAARLLATRPSRQPVSFHDCWQLSNGVGVQKNRRNAQNAWMR